MLSFQEKERAANLRENRGEISPLEEREEGVKMVGTFSYKIICNIIVYGAKKTMTTFLLFESASGYALFEASGFDEVASSTLSLIHI